MYKSTIDVVGRGEPSRAVAGPNRPHTRARLARRPPPPRCPSSERDERYARRRRRCIRVYVSRVVHRARFAKT